MVVLGSIGAVVVAACVIASWVYAVAFDYGLNTVRVVGQLTAPQAERAGTEMATWLAA